MLDFINCTEITSVTYRLNGLSPLLEEKVTVETLLKFQHLVAKNLREYFDIHDFQKQEMATALYDVPELFLEFMDMSPEDYFRHSGITEQNIDRIFLDDDFTLKELIEMQHLHHPSGKSVYNFTIH